MGGGLGLCFLCLSLIQLPALPQLGKYKVFNVSKHIEYSISFIFENLSLSPLTCSHLLYLDGGCAAGTGDGPPPLLGGPLLSSWGWDLMLPGSHIFPFLVYTLPLAEPAFQQKRCLGGVSGDRPVSTLWCHPRPPPPVTVRLGIEPQRELSSPECSRGPPFEAIALLLLPGLVWGAPQLLGHRFSVGCVFLEACRTCSFPTC